MLDTQSLCNLDTQFLYNTVGSGLYCHAGSLLAAASGDLLATWYAYPEFEHAGATLMMARHPRGSTLWLPSEAPIPFSSSSAGNPVLFEERSGRVWLFFVLLEGSCWNDAVLHGASSDDGGRSWSPPSALLPARGIMVRHPPVLGASGEWLLPVYDQRRKHAAVLAAAPPFRTWRVVHAFDDLPQIQPVLVREPGRLTLLFQPPADPGLVWRSHSTDEGRSWSSPLRTTLHDSLSGISAFSAEGRLAVVYHRTEQHERRPLNMAVSDDGGRVWSEPRQIDDLHGEVSCPSFVAGPDGTLHGLYTYNRRLMKYVRLGAGWLQ